MKNITLNEFESSMKNVLSGVVLEGDIFKVDYPTGEPGTAFVVMEEQQYTSLNEAMRILLVLTTKGILTAEMIEPYAKKEMTFLNLSNKHH